MRVPCRRRLPRKKAIIKRANEGRAILVAALAAGSRPTASSRLRKLCLREAYIESRSQTIHAAAFVLVAFIIAPAFSLFFFHFYMNSPRTNIAAIFALAICVALASAIGTRNGAMVGAVALGLALLIVLLFTWLASFDSGVNGDSPVDAMRWAAIPTQGFAAAIGVWFLLAAAAVIAITMIGTAITAVECRRFPEATMLFYILRVANATSTEQRFQDGRYRRRAILDLEYIARAIEHGLSRTPGISPELAAIVRARTNSAASAVREKQVWIALPGPQTRADILEFCLSLLQVLESGRYDQLPVATVAMTQKERITKSAVGVMRVLLGAVLPLAVVATLDALNVLPGGTLGLGIYATFSLVAVVSVMTIIDPGFVSRIVTVKDLAAIFKDSTASK